MKFIRMISVVLTLCLMLTMFPSIAWAKETDGRCTNTDAQMAEPQEGWGAADTVSLEHCHPAGPVPYDNNDDGQPYLYIGVGSNQFCPAVSGSKGRIVPLLDYTEYPLCAKYVDEKGNTYDVEKECQWKLGSDDVECLLDAITGKPVIRTLSSTSKVIEITASYTTPDGTTISSANPLRIQIQQLKLEGNKELLQYAALSYAVYTNFGVGSFSNLTIDSLLDGTTLADSTKYISTKSNSGAKFINLYSAAISGWKVCHARKLSDGFYAALFQSPEGRYVLAFRGTEPIEDKFADLAADICLGTGGDAAQLQHALIYYDDLVKWGYSDITLTGHSLGGGLANYVSVLRGVNACTFNAPSTMMSAVYGNTVNFGRNFVGLNDNQRTDYVNPRDWVGNTGIGDNPLSTETGNVVLCLNQVRGGRLDRTTFVSDQSGINGKEYPIIAPYHFFRQMISYNSANQSISILRDGNTTNPTCYSFYSHTALGLVGPEPRRFTLGSVNRDSLSLENSGNDFIFTGSGNDTIVLNDGSSQKSQYNTVCAGKGNDLIEGSSTTDEHYLYFAGDGCDEIHDKGGNDVISLYGYQDSNLSIKRSSVGTDDDFYVDIYGDDTRILRLSTHGNGSYTIRNETTNTEIETISRYVPSSISSYCAECPVNMLIRDPSGTIVCELKDGVEMEEYLSFGSFSVMERDGEYVKTASIYEDGYTVELVGVGEGTMSYTNTIIENSGSVIRSVENVPIESGAVYTAVTEADNHTVLNGDSVHDDIVFYAPESLSISKTQDTLHYSESTSLAAAVFPQAAVQSVYWSSSDTSVAVVDDNGTVTAVGAGSAVITATSSFDDAIADTCTITVSDEPISLETAMVSGIEENYVCTGSAIIPELTISLGDYTLLEGVDYELTCENNVEAGTATVTINGIGYFAGTQSRTYVIRPLTVDEKVGQLVEECLASGAETDRDKALWFHDWLIYNANYDHTYTEFGPDGVLLKGTGVCQSYADAYSALLTAAGIENIVVTAPEMNHAWNIVNIDGVYTHIDCTWDDPNSGGLEYDYYFGLGDSEMAQDHIWDTDSYPACQRLPLQTAEPSLPVAFDLIDPVQGVEFTLRGVGGSTITRESVESAGGNVLLVFGRPNCPNTMALLQSLNDWHEVLARHNVQVVAVMEDEAQTEEISAQFDFNCGYNMDVYEAWQFNQRIGLTGGYMFPQVVLQNPQGYAFYHSTGYVYEPEKLVATAIQELPGSGQISYSPVSFYANQAEMKQLILSALKNRTDIIKLCHSATSEISDEDLNVALDYINEAGLPYGGSCRWYSPWGTELVIGFEYKSSGGTEAPAPPGGTETPSPPQNSMGNTGNKPIAKKMTLSKASYVYNGRAQKPAVTVFDDKGNKIPGAYYVVSYKNNKKVGTATVTVTLQNGYSGTLKKNFTIKPKGTKLTSLTGARKSISIKWAKQKTQTTGYQLQYSVSSKFSKKATVTKTVKKNTTTKLTAKKLKVKKAYYVRIRTYKTVNGKKYYSAWSKVRKVNTKK